MQKYFGNLWIAYYVAQALRMSELPLERQPSLRRINGRCGLPHLRLSAAVCLGAVAISSVACSTTTKVNNAGDPTHSTAAPKTLVVFGGGLDEADRRSLEDTFVSALIAHGVRATPSYKLFPGTLPSWKEARATLQQATVDGALVSKLRVLRKNTMSVGKDGAPESWAVLQTPGWGDAYDPDRIAGGVIVRFETSLWDVHAAKVVWSANTQTDKASLAKDFASSLTRALVPEMVKDGALPPTVSSTEVSYSPPLFHSK
jgi:hypothetical protein